MTPKEYFEIIKAKKNKITDEDLLRLYENGLTLLNKFKITNQKAGALKIIFHLQCLEKEREVVRAGIDTFVYRDDIEEYIDNIAKNTVKIIELENYEREIPDDIVATVERVGHLFDKLYVLFTDYTGKEERKVEKARREKDPILFGTFQENNRRNNIIIDRFYYLGDWEDEYCDLTLDKLIGEFKESKQRDVAIHIATPQDVEEFKAQLLKLESRNDRFIFNNNIKLDTLSTKTESPKQEEPAPEPVTEEVEPVVPEGPAVITEPSEPMQRINEQVAFFKSAQAGLCKNETLIDKVKSFFKKGK